MRVPILDLKGQYQTIKEEIDRAVGEVLESQQFILGPKVRECEEAVALRCACDYAIGVSSGTDALLVSLMAEEVGPGDEVITTPYTFFSTAGCIARTGATPVFVDIRPDTYNINPELVEERVNDKTRAIIPVHLFGQVAEMDAFVEIAKRNKLTVIEDAAQAIGAEYKGRRAGSLGEYGCFSFYPTKNLGGIGDGGMVSTNDKNRAEKLAALRVHGSKIKYTHPMIGGNFRLDAIQAAVVLVKLRWLDQWTAARQANARRYDGLFESSGLVGRGLVGLPVGRDHGHIFNQYVIRVANRDGLRQALQAHGVGTEIYYPVPMHLQECFGYLGCRAGDFPESERAAKETLALPIFPELTDAQAEYLVSCVRDFFAA